MESGRESHILKKSLALSIELIGVLPKWQRSISDQKDMRSLLARIASPGERRLYRAEAHAKITGDRRRLDALTNH